MIITHSLIFALLLLLMVATSQATLHLNNTATEPPRFVKKMPAVVYKTAGNIVRFKCPAEGNPVPNITWYKNSKTPVSRNLGTIRLERWSISLEDLVPSDSADYTCEVCNSLGCINFTYKLEVFERVNHKPIFTEQPKNVTVKHGGDANLTCTYVSDLHSHLTWFKNYNDSIPNKAINTNPQRPDILELHNVTFEDEGFYTCVASSWLGYSYASAYLRVVSRHCKLI